MYLSICVSISCSNQKHRHRDATCPNQLNQGRSCKNIRQQAQQQRKRKKHWHWNQHQNIMANNVRNHKQAFEGLASACHHQIQQTKQEAIGSEKDVYLITVHRWYHMDKTLTTCLYQDWESSELWTKVGHDASVMNGQQTQTTTSTKVTGQPIWREIFIQRTPWRRWRKQPTNRQGLSNINAKTTNKTNDQGTQPNPQT